MRLSEAFSDPKSSVYRVIMFADIVGSTELKEQHPGVEWLNSLVWYYDTCSESVEAHNGHLVKYLGDGVLAAFDDAADAINAAIQIQERVAEGNHNWLVRCSCSVGLAAGQVIEFTAGMGTDYVGTVVDCAARLSSGASAQAIFADAATVTSAPMHKVRSQIGTVMHRTPDQYAGDTQEVALKGFSQNVRYHEVLWSSQLFGVKSGTVTEAAQSKRVLGTVQPAASNPVTDLRTEPGVGRVINWSPEREFGFIVDERNESFYFRASDVATDFGSLAKGRRVYFTPRDAVVAGKNRIAACVLEVNAIASGTVQRLLDEKGFGFVSVTADSGATRSVFWWFGEDTGKVVCGDVVRFRVSENKRGAVAADVVSTVRHDSQLPMAG